MEDRIVADRFVVAKDAPPPVVPLTVREVERRAKRSHALRSPPRGAIFAVQCGSAIVTGHPKRGEPLTLTVSVLSLDVSDEGLATRDRAILAVAGAARACGFEVVEALPFPAPGENSRALLQHGWLRGLLVGPARRLTPELGGYTWIVPRRAGELVVAPITRAQASAAVKLWHSHSAPPQGAMFNLGVFSTATGGLLCVAQVGRPPARMLSKGAAVPPAEVTRVASSRRQKDAPANGADPARNAATMALGACVRALLSLGYRRIVSYTMLGELGWSYRVAGWRPTNIARGTPSTIASSWSRKGRPRAAPKTTGRKVRWETGPDAVKLPPEAAAAVEQELVDNLWPENRR
jgi:hypothetical protein